VLSIRADAPYHGNYARDDAAEDCCIRLPVCRLCVPASCWRPDIYTSQHQYVMSQSSFRSCAHAWGTCEMNVSIYPVAMPLTATTHDIFPPPLLNSCVGLIVGKYVSPLYYWRGGGSDVGGAGLLSGLELAGCSGVLASRRSMSRVGTGDMDNFDTSINLYHNTRAGHYFRASSMLGRNR
jgi:hypothetical protein